LAEAENHMLTATVTSLIVLGIVVIVIRGSRDYAPESPIRVWATRLGSCHHHSVARERSLLPGQHAIQPRRPHPLAWLYSKYHRDFIGMDGLP
jgi:hypothetical protein